MIWNQYSLITITINYHLDACVRFEIFPKTGPTLPAVHVRRCFVYKQKWEGTKNVYNNFLLTIIFVRNLKNFNNFRLSAFQKENYITSFDTWLITALYVRSSYMRGGLRTTDSQTGRIDPARLNYRTGTEN